MFYHRCSRGVQQYRRLCIEPIVINEDGSIDEVKMTSQGAGEPFALGEMIMGYQACELYGTAYTDVDRQYGEKITHISVGDQVVFRYVKSEHPISEIVINASGSGRIQVMQNLDMVGVIVIENGIQRNFEIHGEALLCEVALYFEVSDSLEINSLILNS